MRRPLLSESRGGILLQRELSPARGVVRVLALRLGHVVSLASSGLDAAYADCRKASAAIVALIRLGALLGSAGRSRGATAGVHRPLADAEFRAYIKVAVYCQYINILIRNNRL